MILVTDLCIHKGQAPPYNKITIERSPSTHCVYLVAISLDKPSAPKKSAVLVDKK